MSAATLGTALNNDSLQKDLYAKRDLRQRWGMFAVILALLIALVITLSVFIKHDEMEKEDEADAASCPAEYNLFDVYAKLYSWANDNSTETQRNLGLAKTGVPSFLCTLHDVCSVLSHTA
jgi:hypothetical protein